jgi:hypothetical protein
MGEDGENVANMPQPCVAACGCVEGIWLPSLGHCCLSSTAYIGDSHYLDKISINAVIVNAHLCASLLTRRTESVDNWIDI